MNKKIFLICLLSVNALSAQAAFFEDEDARKAILDLREKVTDYEKRLTSLDASLSGRLTQNETKTSAANERLDLSEKSRIASLSLSSDIDSLRREFEQIHDQLDVVMKKQKDLSVELDVLQRSANSSDQTNKTLELVQQTQKDLEAISQLRLKEVELEGVRGLALDQETQLYESASALFREEKFTEAELAFESFLQRFPSSFYAQFALFWYANTAYANQKYKEATYRYRSFINVFVVNPRVPDALLALAVSQKEVKDSAFSSTVAVLRERFPASDAAKNSISYFPEVENATTQKKPEFDSKLTQSKLSHKQINRQETTKKVKK